MRKFPAAVFLILFLLGYNAEISIVQQSNAQATVTSPGTATQTFCSCNYCESCELIGVSAGIKTALEKALKENLIQSAKEVEQKLSDLDDDMTEKLLKRLNQTELDIIDWWRTMWAYGWKPALQHKTDQLNTATADQSRMLQSATDAQNQVETKLELEKNAIEANRTFRPAPNPCGDATIAGGQGRAASFSQRMRANWQKDILAVGLNKKGTVGATGALSAERQRYEDYKELFCDPDGNGGNNDCNPPPTDTKYINADTQPTKFINNQLTIDVKDPKMEKTVETVNNNMMGVPSADQLSKGALLSSPGQGTFLDRRSYLARYAAARTVPGLVTGWRMPGSQTGVWLKGLREGAGIPLKNISSNPSYKEIMHAETIDRFNSGRYAVGMITDESEIEMEKLTLNAFYLMQLRDYYELLERTALTLAVQVSMMVDQVPVPNAMSVAPMK
jgi:hypothetical protein